MKLRLINIGLREAADGTTQAATRQMGFRNLTITAGQLHVDSVAGTCDYMRCF
jgi:hypothetical protein